MKFLPALILNFALLLGTSTAAEDPALQRQQARQQQIQKSTASAGNKIALLLAEFERNGITGQDIDLLTGIGTVLGDLSTDQMGEIVTLLTDAESTADPRLITAHAGQKAAIVQLRQVIIQYQRQLALDQIAHLIRKLGDRQSANLHEALAILGATTNGQPSRTQKISVQLQASEQASLRDEVAPLILRIISIVARDPTNTDDRPVSAVRLATDQKLNDNLTSAARELEFGKLMAAAGSQKNARDTLWQLAELLQSEKDDTARLIEAAAEIQRLIKAEQSVIAKTASLEKPPVIPGAKNLELQPRVQKARQQIRDVAQRGADAIQRDTQQLEKTKQQQAEKIAQVEAMLAAPEDEKARNKLQQDLQRAQKNRERQLRTATDRVRRQKEAADRATTKAERNLGRALEEASRKLKLPTPSDIHSETVQDAARLQGETLDKTDFLAGTLKEFTPETSASLDRAVANMQQTRSALTSEKPLPQLQQDATNSATAALTNLQTSLQTVLEKLQKSQLASAVDPQEPTANQTQQLAQLLEQVRQLQKGQDDLQQNPDQQQAPQEALEQRTQQAQQDANSTAPAAASDLAAAVEMMQAASAEIQAGESPADSQQTASDALAQAAETLEAELEEAQAKQAELDKIANTLEKLNPIIKEQQDLQTDTNNPSADTKSLAEQQSDLQKTTSELGQESANPEITQASQQQQQASQALAQSQSQAARQPQSEALQNLNAAKQSLEQRQSELAAELGQSTPPPAAFEELAQAIAKAQQQVGEGQQQLAADQPSTAGQPLAAAADTISPFTAGTEGHLPPAVQSALQAAQQSLADSTAAAAEEKTAPAQTAAGAAQQSLAEASAALALAQAGLSAPAPPSEEPGKPGEEGKKPGDGKGDKPGEKPGPSNGGEPSYANKPDGEKKRNPADGGSRFIGLPDRQRGTLRQGTADSYPAEFSSMIEQYLKNLSDDSGETE